MAKLILLACQPKSASTFLSAYLSNLGGGNPYRFVHGYGRREQELDELWLLRAKIKRGRFLVGQHHIRHSGETERLIRRYDMSVVVLYRNLFDAVASLRDHIRREDHVQPMFYMTKEMAALPDRDLEVALARFAIPWYLNFFMSWRDYKNAIFVDYEEMRTDAERTAKGILDSFGLKTQNRPADLEKLRQATRFNSGVAGRGAEIAPEAIQLIRDQVNFYLRFVEDEYLKQHCS